MTSLSEPGLIIKNRREELDLTIRELARRTGLSASFISQIERGKSNVSLESLGKLAEQLDCSMKDFFQELDPLNELAAEPEQACLDTPAGAEEYNPVVRRGCRPRLVLPNSGVSYELLMNDINREMEAVYGRISPGSGNVVRRLRTPTEELIFVIAGQIKVVLNDREYLLDPGDSVYFNGYDLQELRCASTDQDSIWISIITPPIF